MNVTREDGEIRLEITHIVEAWLSGELENNGLLVRGLSERESNFHWIRDGRYDGSNAKVEILYSRK